MRILESSVLGFTGQALGATIWGQQFLGARFSVTQPVHVTAVGGHLAADYTETLFAAIVRLSSPMGLPTFAPRTIESAALASTVFIPPRPSGDVLMPLSADLGAGDYALVFGGADSAVDFFPFGARGTGVMPLNNVPFPTSSYILGNAFRWTDNPAIGARFTVAGDVSAPSAPTGLNVS